MSFKDTIKNKIWNTFAPENVLNQIENNTIDTWTHLIDLSNDSETLTENNALTTFGSVYSVVKILAEDVASLPLQVYKSENGKREKLGLDNNVAYLLNKKVNSRMTPFEWKAKVITDLSIFGNHFSLLKFNRAGDVSEIIPLDPSVTSVFRTDTGQLFYKTTYNNEQIELLDYEVIHIKNSLTQNGLGISPLTAIRLNAEAIKSGEAMNHALLESRGIPKGIISVAGSLSSEAKANVKAQWKRANSEAGNGVVVLDSGLEYRSLGQTNQDLDFLNGMNYNLERVAAAYRVPPNKINQNERSTFSNVTEMNLDYISSALQPLIKNIEEVLNVTLFTDKEVRAGFYVKFNINALLRSEPETLARTLEIQLRAGMISLDESRDLLEMNPYDEEWSRVPYLTKNYSTLSDETLNNEPEVKEVTDE